MLGPSTRACTGVNGRGLYDPCSALSVPSAICKVKGTSLLAVLDGNDGRRTWYDSCSELRTSIWHLYRFVRVVESSPGGVRRVIDWRMITRPFCVEWDLFTWFIHLHTVLFSLCQ